MDRKKHRAVSASADTEMFAVAGLSGGERLSVYV